MENEDLGQQQFCEVIDDITSSISSVREVVKSLREKSVLFLCVLPDLNPATKTK
jgi:hypothetical protein